MTRLLPGKKELEKGQAVLVVLLVMSVLLTLGLSVVSRSVTDVKISQQSQESARAFWTAQAGLEKALLAQSDIPDDTIDGVSYAVTKSALGGGTKFVFPEKIEVGENFVYWLVDHNPDGSIGTTFYSGNLKVYWGNHGDTDTALIVSLIYKDASGHFQSKKFTYDPVTRIPPTNFTSPPPGGGVLSGITFAHTTPWITVPLPLNKPYFANIKMIFNTSPQIVGVETSAVGPVQGSCYESKATVTVSNIVRNLKECRTWPQTPGIFDYLLFSGEDI